MVSITIPDPAYVVARLASVSRLTAKRVVVAASSPVKNAYYNCSDDTITIIAPTNAQADKIWDRVWQNIKNAVNRDRVAA